MKDEEQLSLALPVASMGDLEASKVRRQFYKGKWWFVIVDVIEVLTNSPYPSQYWVKMQRRENIDLKPNWLQLKIKAIDGKTYPYDCVNEEGLYRLLQSIPSPKLAAFKNWVARVVMERVEEDRDPELAQRRVSARNVQFFTKLGHTKEQAKKRVEGIQFRNMATDLMAAGKLPYAATTNAFNIAATGMAVQELKAYKGLKKSENLRDHMTPKELCLSNFTENMFACEVDSSEAKTPEDYRAAVERATAIAVGARTVAEKHSGKIASPESPLKPQAKLFKKKK